MSREEVLLKEYELCQTETDTNSANYWTVSGIFIGISTALLGTMAVGIISAKDFNKWILLILVSIFGLAVFFFHAVIREWLKRVTFLNDIDYNRMREIEKELGMRKSGLVWGLDNWKEISISYRLSILCAWPLISDNDRSLYINRPKHELPDYLIVPKRGRNIIPRFFWINSFLWGSMILLSLLRAILNIG